MESIDLPCNNCILLPRCISRLKEEDIYKSIFNDVLPFYSLIENCSLLHDYFPFKYEDYPTSFASNDTDDTELLDYKTIHDILLLDDTELQLKILKILHRKERQGTVYMPRKEWNRRFFAIMDTFDRYIRYIDLED